MPALSKLIIYAVLLNLLLFVIELGEIVDESRHSLCPPIDDDEFAILHHQAVRSVCSQFPAYAAAVRLMRVWIDSVMLSGHVTVPMIEVLVASVFINTTASLHTPTTPSAAFAQTLFK